METHHLEKWFFKICLKSHHWSHSLHFTHLYFVDYVGKDYLAADAEVKPTACHLYDETTLFLITVPFSRKSLRKWCPAVPVYNSGCSHLLWLDIIFHKVKCALREKSVAALTYNSAVKCQSMSGGRWTWIWSERCIKVGLDGMRFLTLCHFGNWCTADVFRVSVSHVCSVMIVTVHKYDMPMKIENILNDWWLLRRFRSQYGPRHQGWCQI